MVRGKDKETSMPMDTGLAQVVLMPELGCS
jgi:hypothetical protein